MLGYDENEMATEEIVTLAKDRCTCERLKSPAPQPKDDDDDEDEQLIKISRKVQSLQLLI